MELSARELAVQMAGKILVDIRRSEEWQTTGVILDFLQRHTEYQQARHLAGGMLGWLNAGLPVERVSD
jgi:rhodanese-related sulfurtransferase